MVKISRAERFSGRVALLYESLIKGTDYFFVLYPFVYDWYDALLFRAGLRKRHRLRPRSKVVPGWFVRNVIHLFNKEFSIPNQDLKDGLLSIKYANKEVRFLITDNRQLEEVLRVITEQFLEKQYDWLRVQKRQVIDVGAGFGDTPIYFTLKGARKVMAFEPYPYSFNVASENIKMNKMQGRIFMLNQAVGGRMGSIVLNPNLQNGGKNRLEKFGGGKNVKIVTLESIVKRYAIKDAILKVDCEGGEYDILLNTNDATLRRFEQIMVEFHFGLKSLEEKLRSAGFRVRHSVPIYCKIANFHSNLYGMIFAERMPEPL